DIQFVERCHDIDESLWRKCFPVNLEGLFWYRTLEAAGLEDQFTFFYAVIRSSGRPVGIAPCFLHDVPMSLVAPPVFALLLKGLSKVVPRVGYQRTVFVGSPCSDEGTIGLLNGFSLVDIIPSLRVALEKKARTLGASMILFKDFRTGEAQILQQACSDEGYFS